MYLALEEEEGGNGVYAILVGDSRVCLDIHLEAWRLGGSGFRGFRGFRAQGASGLKAGGVLGRCETS